MLGSLGSFLFLSQHAFLESSSNPQSEKKHSENKLIALRGSYTPAKSKIYKMPRMRKVK